MKRVIRSAEYVKAFTDEECIVSLVLYRANILRDDLEDMSKEDLREAGLLPLYHALLDAIRSLSEDA